MRGGACRWLGSGGGGVLAPVDSLVPCRKWLLANAAFAAVLLLAVSPLLLGKTEPTWDARDYLYPAFAYFQAAMRAGRLPLWDPYTACGMPFLAEPQISYLLSPFALILA